jgi:hypothetical protein
MNIFSIGGLRNVGGRVHCMVAIGEKADSEQAALKKLNL